MPRFRQAGGNRPCRCRCRYCVSPLRMSNWIPLSRSRSQPSCTHRHPGPGRRPLAMIWPNLTLSAAMSSSPVSDVVPVVAGLCHSVPSFHWCLRRLWTGGLWSHLSSTLPSCVWICQLLQAGSRNSNPRGHRYPWRVWTRWSPSRRRPTTRR